MLISRRSFLTAVGASSLLAAPKQKIASVRVWPVDLSINPGGVFHREAQKFSSDYDPRRWRSFGPFSQLIGAIMVEIRTDQGITGYGMGGGGGAGKFIIDHHLADLLAGADPLQPELL